jgi:EAL domain-containing protein (putative c-di-GMP-specific phosphodiesterase class I)/PleD family two-component response regulator
MITQLADHSGRLGFLALARHSQQLSDQLQIFIEKGSVPDAVEKAQIQASLTGIAQSLDGYSRDLKPLSPLGDVPQKLPDDTIYTAASVGVPSDKKAALIYILEPDDAVATPVANVLRFLGHQVVYFNQPQRLQEAVRVTRPTLIVSEIAFSEDVDLGLRIARDLKSEVSGNLPIIFVSSRGDMQARLGALAVGGADFFLKPVAVEAVIESIDRLLGGPGVDCPKVLIVGGCAEEGQALMLALQGIGIQAEYEINLLKLLDSVAVADPDLLVLDVVNAQVSGGALTQVLHQSGLHSEMPIIVLEGEQGRINTVSEQQNGPMALEDKHIVARLSKTASPEKVLGTVTDLIGHVHAVHQTLEKLRHCDRVTGVLNRQAILALLAVSVAQASLSEPKALLALVIDHAQALQKKMGFQWDAVMHQVSILLRAQLPEEVEVGRLDEHTFLMIWPASVGGASSDALLAQSDVLRQRLGAYPLVLSQTNIQLTASIGIAPIIAPIAQSADGASLLLRRVAYLAAQAFVAGGNCCRAFTPEAGHTLTVSQCAHNWSSRPALPPGSDAALHEALEQQAFDLVFQPILKTADTGDELYETLLRLHDTHNNVFLPAQFLPIVARYQLFPQLDRWVIEHAVDQLCHDLHAKAAASLFIKISGESLGKKTLLPWISNLKNSAGIRGHHRLIFEISEPEVFDHLHEFEAFIQGLADLDCGVTLDHFGCSEYGLSLLDYISVDYVKLHGPLVRAGLASGKDRIKLKTLIEVARQHRAAVIAGSVENTKIMSLLCGLGVSHFQGYFIQQPHAQFDFDFKGLEL